MTLVLSYLNKDHIIQISDRRFSSVYGSKQVQGNKAVAFAGRLSFGYTGFAELYNDITHENLGTDIWLQKTLVHACEKYPLQDNSPVWLSNISNLIATKAELALNRIRLNHPGLPGGYRQAFVGVGWEVVDHLTDELRPVMVKISNFHDESGKELSETSIKFNVIWKYLQENEAFYLDFTGVPISGESQKRIRSRFETLHKRNKGPVEKTELLIRVLYWVAEQGPHVSKDLMGVNLPKNAVMQQRSGKVGLSGGASIDDFPPNATSAVGWYGPTGGWLFANSFPSSDGVAYFHLPEGINEPIWHSPIFVDPSGFAGHVVISPINSTDLTATLPNSQPLYERCQTTVLSDWSEKYDAMFGMYERYPLLQDHYKDYEISDISMAIAWEHDEPCPYYGVALCAKLPDADLEKLQVDTRYFVITSPDYDPFEIPDVVWIERLKSWLEIRHVPENELNLLIKIIRPLQRKDILDRLRLMMATRREVLSAQFRQIHGE